MTARERKRQVGYFDLLLTQTCGNCRYCKRNGSHLRCEMYEFPVQSLGICRAGWTAEDLPVTPEEHPLFFVHEERPLLTYDPDAVEAFV